MRRMDCTGENRRRAGITKFWETSLHCLNLAILTFVNFDVSVIILRLDSKTASIIATSIVHSKLDYCNSL